MITAILKRLSKTQWFKGERTLLLAHMGVQGSPPYGHLETKDDNCDAILKTKL